MASHTAPVDPKSPKVTNPALAGVVLLAAVFAFSGLIGHDPWKQDEPYSFGIIYNMYLTGDLVVPRLAADPFMEKPPAYYITALGIVHLLDDWLPLHDAARLATGLYLCLAFLFTGLLGRATWGPGHGGLAVLTLMSTLELNHNGHYLITDIALTAGMAMAFFGLALARQKVLLGGFWLGTGAGLAFMSKGLLGPGIVGLSALLMPIMFSSWRSATYLKALAIAALSVLPWALIWPTLLYLRDAELFMRWFWDNNFGRFFGFSELGTPARDFFWLRTFYWVTFPAFPLALFALWKRRGEAFANEAVRALLVVSVVAWILLFTSHTARDLYALPLLAPLAVIAAGAVTRLPAGANRMIYWASGLLFAALAVFLWYVWVHGLVAGTPPHIGLIARYLPMDFTPIWRTGAFLMALTLQLGWIWIMIRHRPPGPGALLSWPAGLILVWGLIAALHFPWIDSANSYRNLFTELKQNIPAEYNCAADLADMRLRECERGLLHYFAGITTEHVRHADDTDCDVMIVEAPVRRVTPDMELGPGWRRVWVGRKPLDRRDIFFIFERVER
jgi:4-amino-4-deoxy-L-arabinose transferase-like glycosyltransferase